jgi:hypothetical protein
MHAELLDGPAAGVLVVLGGLALARRLRVGAGDHGHYLVAADAERRLALGRVECCKASGRACPRVDEAPAAAQPLDDLVDDVGDRCCFHSDRVRHQRILAVHRQHELGRGEQV